MNIPVDIHTHRLPQVPGTAIANCYPETFSPQSGGWYSVGIHPWHIGRSGGEHSGVEGAVASRVCGLEELVRHPQVLAVGEAGLDKLADAPMDLQVEVFRCQACLAEEVGKPLVIHLVKAVDELLKVKRDLRPSNPWIIHGFRGKAALVEEYLKHGFYLSFGEKYQEAKFPSGNCMHALPKCAASLPRSLEKHSGEMSAKSFLNPKSCFFE